MDTIIARYKTPNSPLIDCPSKLIRKSNQNVEHMQCPEEVGTLLPE